MLTFCFPGSLFTTSQKIVLCRFPDKVKILGCMAWTMSASSISSERKGSDKKRDVVMLVWVFNLERDLGSELSKGLLVEGVTNYLNPWVKTSSSCFLEICLGFEYDLVDARISFLFFLPFLSKATRREERGAATIRVGYTIQSNSEWIIDSIQRHNPWASGLKIWMSLLVAWWYIWRLTSIPSAGLPIDASRTI